MDDDLKRALAGVAEGVRALIDARHSDAQRQSEFAGNQRAMIEFARDMTKERSAELAEMRRLLMQRGEEYTEHVVDCTGFRKELSETLALMRKDAIDRHTSNTARLTSIEKFIGHGTRWVFGAMLAVIVALLGVIARQHGLTP